jgi:hypothetical protein
MRRAAIEEYLDDIIMNMHRLRVMSRGRRMQLDQRGRTRALLKRAA